MRWLPILVVAVLAAGCGSGRHAAGTTAAPPGAVAFARCMRAHGIPGWPDPTSDGRFDKARLRALPVAGARIRALEDGPCNHLLPTYPESPQTAQQQRTRLADWLSFARCMRGHGVSRFPDPTVQGELSIERVQAAGVDIHSPLVLHVVQACLPASHGAITAAKVQEALQNAGR